MPSPNFLVLPLIDLMMRRMNRKNHSRIAPIRRCKTIPDLDQRAAFDFPYLSLMEFIL